MNILGILHGNPSDFGEIIHKTPLCKCIGFAKKNQKLHTFYTRDMTNTKVKK